MRQALLIAEIVRRTPDMAKDCPMNNEALLRGLFRQAEKPPEPTVNEEIVAIRYVKPLFPFHPIEPITPP